MDTKISRRPFHFKAPEKRRTPSFIMSFMGVRRDYTTSSAQVRNRTWLLPLTAAATAYNNVEVEAVICMEPIKEVQCICSRKRYQEDADREVGHTKGLMFINRHSTRNTDTLSTKASNMKTTSATTGVLNDTVYAA